MNRDRFAGIRGAAVIKAVFSLIFMIAVASTAQPAYAQEAVISVTCFKGNFDEGNILGTIEVAKPETAGEDCNATFYNCGGKCIGCYYDQNADKDVCNDKNGKQVPKPED